MAKVRAKQPCYLGTDHGGYKTPEDGEFEYNGPKHNSLEYLDAPEHDPDDDDKKYHALTRDELKAELARRNIDFAPNAQDKTLRGLLEADDAKQ